MEKGINKDWMDAVRERCLSDEAAPAAGSWVALGARMRRAAARRRAALMSAVALPVVALLLWAPWRERPMPSAPIAQISVPDSSSIVPEQIVEEEIASQPEPLIVIPQSDRSLLANASSSPSSASSSPSFAGSSSPSFAGLTGESPTVIPAHSDASSSKQAPNEDKAVEIVLPSSKQAPDEDKSTEIVHPSLKLAQNEDGGEVLLALDEPKRRHRARISSVSVRAGSSTIRRNAPVSMASAPYVAALNFLNTTDPSLMPQVKSNIYNTVGISTVANDFFPETATGQYTHDLPLSLGLSLQLDLTPKISLETGLEYTYLHSTEEFVGSRLNQRIHFIGIPVRLDATLWTNGGFGIYAGVGAKVEKCVSATLGRVACEEPRLQWSAEVFGGVQYQLSSRMHLYFQPALSYYFTETDLPTYHTEHPLGLTLHAGLRFDL